MNFQTMNNLEYFHINVLKESLYLFFADGVRVERDASQRDAAAHRQPPAVGQTSGRTPKRNSLHGRSGRRVRSKHCRSL